MIDTQAAADTITRMLHAIDDLDREGVRRAFADQVRVDYSSLSGQSQRGVLSLPELARERAVSAPRRRVNHG